MGKNSPQVRGTLGVHGRVTVLSPRCVNRLLHSINSIEEKVAEKVEKNNVSEQYTEQWLGVNSIIEPTTARPPHQSPISSSR